MTTKEMFVSVRPGRSEVLSRRREVFTARNASQRWNAGQKGEPQKTTLLKGVTG